jgi:glycosyltransferase involved in cell wall biosynthesis
MKIVILQESLNIQDGVQHTIRRIVSNLTQHEFYIFGWQHPELEPYNYGEFDHVRTFSVSKSKIQVKQLGEYQYSSNVFRASNTIRKMKQLNPDIIHLTCPFGISLQVKNYAKKNNIPFLFTYHSDFEEYMKSNNFSRMFIPIFRLRFTTLYSKSIVLTPSERTMQYLNDLPYTMKKHRATTLMWGRPVNHTIFNPENKSSEFRDSLNINESDVILLWVSRIVKTKKPIFFINIANQIMKTNENVQTIIVGNGPELENMKSKMRFENRTHFLGFQDHTTLPTIYASSDIFILPSPVETFGNVTLEAMASRLSCVGHINSTNHLLQDNCGIIHENFNLNEWKFSVETLIQQTETRNEISENAFTKSLSFTENNLMNNLNQIYQSIKN